MTEPSSGPSFSPSQKEMLKNLMEPVSEVSTLDSSLAALDVTLQNPTVWARYYSERMQSIARKRQVDCTKTVEELFLLDHDYSKEESGKSGKCFKAPVKVLFCLAPEDDYQDNPTDNK